MHLQIGAAKIELVQGDIVMQAVDAIVNAANCALSGGGGVDGAIHRGGGPAIMAETDARYPEGCPTGSAVITGGGDLPVKHVIHAVGPIYRDGQRGEAEQLAGAYRRALELAVAHDCQSVAFPALSMGAYRYPRAEAAAIAVRTVAEFLRVEGRPELVRFVLFDEPAFEVFRTALSDLSRRE